MANAEQLEILKQGVEVWSEWRAKNIPADVDLKEADLSGANLTETNLVKEDSDDPNTLSLN